MKAQYAPERVGTYVNVKELVAPDCASEQQHERDIFRRGKKRTNSTSRAQCYWDEHCDREDIAQPEEEHWLEHWPSLAHLAAKHCPHRVLRDPQPERHVGLLAN